MAQIPENIKKMEGTIFDIKSKISNQEYISLMNLLAQVYKDVKHLHQQHTQVCKVAKRVGPLEELVRKLLRWRAAERLRVNPFNKTLQNHNESFRKKLELMELEQELQRLGLMEEGQFSDR